MPDRIVNLKTRYADVLRENVGLSIELGKVPAALWANVEARPARVQQALSQWLRQLVMPDGVDIPNDVEAYSPPQDEGGGLIIGGGG